MISVEKIGGTLDVRLRDVRHIMLYDKSRILGRIYVVSAYSGVTNQLLEHKKTGERGICTPCSRKVPTYHGALTRSRSALEAQRRLRLSSSCRWTSPTPSSTPASARLQEKYLDAMQHARQRLHPPPGRAARRARGAGLGGESHSAFNSVVEILKGQWRQRHPASTSPASTTTRDGPSTSASQQLLGARPDNSVMSPPATRANRGHHARVRPRLLEVTFSKIAVEVRLAEAVIRQEFHLPRPTQTSSAWRTR